MSGRYHCDWCGWNGSQVDEQRMLMGLEFRYVCYQCGMEIKPGPWGATAYGVNEDPIPEEER